MPDDHPMVYQLRVSLMGVEPEIWRSLEVRAETPLSKLHAILQVAMGWENSHLHVFRSGRQRFGVRLEDDFGPPVIDERRVTVAEVLPGVRKKLVYEYDFGDGWEHEIKVVAIGAAVDGVKYPRCIAGARACPIEDCGGPGGYMQILEELAAPPGRETSELLDWVGEGFDPEQFDQKAVNRQLGRMR